MTTARHVLTNDQWTLIGAGAHDLQRENSNETIYLHFGSVAPTLNIRDHARIIDNAVYPYRGNDNVYARSLGAHAALIASAVVIDGGALPSGGATATKQDDQTALLTQIANATLPDKETPYIVFRCNTAFTGASVGDTIAGILTINTVTNAFVSATPLWFNFSTSAAVTVADTSKLTAVAANALTASELAAMTLKVDDDASQVLLGDVVETAPPTDTASSGLNGRLQRIAQRLTSLIALLPTALVNGRLSVDATPAARTPTAYTFTITTAWQTYTLAANNPSRKGLIICNFTTELLWINYGVGSSQLSFSIAIGATFIMPEMAFYTGQISGYTGASSGTILVTELS